MFLTSNCKELQDFVFSGKTFTQILFNFLNSQIISVQLRFNIQVLLLTGCSATDGTENIVRSS